MVGRVNVPAEPPARQADERTTRIAERSAASHSVEVKRAAVTMRMEGSVEIETLMAALRLLATKRLDSVVFVLDYIQLNFGNACLSILTDIRINDDRGVFEWNQDCSRDAICRRIGSVVVEAARAGDRIILRFQDGAQLSFSIAEEARSGPEAVNFDDGEGRWYVV